MASDPIRSYCLCLPELGLQACVAKLVCLHDAQDARTTYSLLTKLSPHPQVTSADCADWSQTVQSAPTALAREMLSAVPAHRGQFFCVEIVPYGVHQVFKDLFIFMLCVQAFLSPCISVYMETEPGSSARAKSALGCHALSPPWVCHS